jgi:hypothetical protein
MILYIENAKNSTKKLLELINFSKIAEYKIKHKNQHFCMLIVSYLKRNQENNPIYNCNKNKIKYLEINLEKEMKDLYDENSKTLMEKIRENTNN